MAEYIEREVAKAVIKRRLGTLDLFESRFNADIDAVPAADVVEVVRCKDCKHFNMREMECQNDAVSTDHEGGASYSLNFYLDDFCSRGERRDDATDRR